MVVQLNADVNQSTVTTMLSRLLLQVFYITFYIIIIVIIKAHEKSMVEDYRYISFHMWWA